MSAITIENDLVHYEVLGRGRPVLLIHGWLGSWRYWIPSMQQLSTKYRVYALDLWGFGDSGKDARRYDFGSQVTLLDQFMEKMGITKAALVGHGLGGAVAARYAALRPDRVPRLMVIGPPLFHMAPSISALTANFPRLPGALPNPNSVPVHSEADTIPWRSDEMRSRIQAALEQRMRQLDDDSRPAPPPPSLPEPLPAVPAMPKVDYVPDPQAQQANPLKSHLQVLDPLALLERHVEAGADLEKLRVEVSKADRNVIAVSVDSFAMVDTLRDLKALPMQLVALYGVDDTFMPPPDAEMVSELVEGRTNCAVIAMPETRHFPMLENVTEFNRLLLDFLEIPDVRSLAIKKTWERRVR